RRESCGGPSRHTHIASTGRQTHCYLKSSTLTFADGNGAAHRPRDVAGDRKTEPRAGPAASGALEPFENAFAHVVRNSGPAISDQQDNAVCLIAQINADLTGRVRLGILDQIAHHLAKADRLAVNDHGIIW